MSTENLNGFLEKLKNDSSLRAKLEEIKKKFQGEKLNQEIIMIAKEAGFDINCDDLFKTKKVDGELSEDDLSNVSGGKIAWCFNGGFVF